MRTFVFSNGNGDRVHIKADVIGGNSGENSTIMEVKAFPVSGTAAAFFQANPLLHPKKLVSSQTNLKALATSLNYNLKIIDGVTSTTLVTSSTTTTTTTS